MRANEFIAEVTDPNDPSGQTAVVNQGLAIPVASKYAGDGQFKVTIKNKPYIVTVGGFEINRHNPGILDSFYLTNVTSGKTEHVTSGWNDPVSVAIYNNLDQNQKPALVKTYKEDEAFHNKHGWDTRLPRLQGLALSGSVAIPADRFVKAHKDMKKATGQDLGEAQQFPEPRQATPDELRGRHSKQYVVKNGMIYHYMDPRGRLNNAPIKEDEDNGPYIWFKDNPRDPGQPLNMTKDAAIKFVKGRQIMQQQVSDWGALVDNAGRVVFRYDPRGRLPSRFRGAQDDTTQVPPDVYHFPMPTYGSPEWDDMMQRAFGQARGQNVETLLGKPGSAR